MILHPHVVRRASIEQPQIAPQRDSLIVIEVEPVDAVPEFELEAADLDPPTEHDPAPLALIPQSSSTFAPVPAPGPMFARARSRMGSQGDRLSRNLIVELISFVFGRSQMQRLVGADALRMVLSGDQLALFPQPGVLELQMVWDLLEAQPGFDPDHAIAPMCRLKVLESRLDLDVLLPAALAALDDAECRRRAAECEIRPSEVERVLCPNKTMPITRVIETIHVEEVARPKPRRLGLAVVAAVIGLAAAGISADRTFNRSHDDDDADTIDTALVSDDLPLLQVKRAGPMLMATLSDMLWVLRPEADRKHQLEGSVDHLRALGASSLVVVEADGTMRASVALDGNEPVITLIPRS